jgi:hypothetical protein
MSTDVQAPRLLTIARETESVVPLAEQPQMFPRDDMDGGCSAERAELAPAVGASAPIGACRRTSACSCSCEKRCGSVKRPGRPLSPKAARVERRTALGEAQRAAAPLGPDLAAVRRLVLVGRSVLPL